MKPFDELYDAGRGIAELTREATLPRYAELLAYAAATAEERGVFGDRAAPLACAFADALAERQSQGAA